jgi:hypothetical protein
MTQPNASIAHRHPAHHRCSVGDVARVPYTRSVTFVVASPHMAVAKSPARSSVRRVARTSGTVGIGAAVIVGHIENLGDTSSFGAVNPMEGVYSIQTTDPMRRRFRGRRSGVTSCGPALSSLRQLTWRLDGQVVWPDPGPRAASCGGRSVDSWQSGVRYRSETAAGRFLCPRSNVSHIFVR